MAHKKIKPATEKQKKKFSHYLADGEDLIAAFSVGSVYYWSNVIGLFPFAVFLVGLPFLLKVVHLKHRYTYLLTNRRVIVKDGVFSVKTISAPYDKITHITVREDFFKKISYGIGDITIHTAGPTPVEIDLIKVQNPIQVKNLIEELIIKERSLLGVITPEKREPIIKPLK